MKKSPRDEKTGRKSRIRTYALEELRKEYFAHLAEEKLRKKEVEELNKVTKEMLTQMIDESSNQEKNRTFWK